MEAELSLINKVELRIALADSDSKFEHSLKVYLAPLLLKLASPHQAVKNEVLKIIRHLTTRFNASPGVKLPLESLLSQAKAPQVASGSETVLVQMYSLVMFSKGIDRITDAEKLPYIPELARGISSINNVAAARLFEVLCKTIVAWTPPERGTDHAAEFRGFLRLDDIPEDEAFLIAKLTNFMLLNPVLPRDGSIPRDISFPGLAASDVAFLTYDAGVTFDSKTLTTYRKKLIPFLEYGFRKKAALPLLVASADSTYLIAEAATAAMKRLTLDHNDLGTVRALVVLLSGDPAKGIPPLKASLEEKILGFLEKSDLDIVGQFLPTILSIGLESDSPRVRRAAVSIIRKSSSMLTDRSGELLGYCDDLASQLRANLESETDSQKSIDYGAAITYRKHQFEALGLLLRHCSPGVLFDYIQFMFRCLLSEDTDMKLTLQDALSSLAEKAGGFPSEHKARLAEALETYLRYDLAESTKSKDESYQSARYLAVKYINSMFPFSDARARLVCILAASSKNRPDTVEEATKGLHPYWFNLRYNQSKSELVFPSFKSMVSVLLAERELFFKGATTLEGSMELAISFSVQCLVMQAVAGKSTVIVKDEQWETRLKSGLELDNDVIQLVIESLKELSTNIDGDDDVAMDSDDQPSSLDLFLGLILKEYIGKSKDGSIVAVSSVSGSTSIKDFARLLSLSPTSTCSYLVKEIPNILFALRRDQFVPEDVITAVGQSIGILASCPEYDNLEVIELVRTLVDPASSLENACSLYILGYVLSRLAVRGRSDILTPDLYDNVFENLIQALASSSNSLQNAALETVSQLAKFGVLGPQITVTSNISDHRIKIKESLKLLVKKLNEKATLAWAYLALSENEQLEGGDELTEFEQAVYDGHNSKQTEYLFASGEALTIIAAGWDSSLMKRYVDIQDPTIKQLVPKRHARLSLILKFVLQACSQTKPSLRKAGCIWLLSLVQYCGHFPVVSASSSEIHVAFMRFLADRDELVQESASRGLSIVYELGDTELKDTLVHELLTSFTDSNKTSLLSSGSVTGDTRLFDPGVLKTNDGSVSTYKDILSLASEVGDPSLVYKFMSLAQNSALWSSRKGIAFGLGSILSKSKLTDLLSSNSNFANKLIPKLFRYTYDPSPTVQRSMNDIWTALVPNPSEVISNNFDLMLEELLSSMGNRDWRVRQASTVALKDLLGYVIMNRYESFLERIWSMSFRAMDDIKESVRKEGQALARSLASTMVNFMASQKNNTDSEEKIHNALSKLIPLLLGPNGVQSEAEEVRNFGLKTLVTICSKFSSSLKPFIPKLAGEMITLMSTVEPQVINYLALNADKYNLTASHIDTHRMQAIGHSPMMEALEMMIGDLDAEILVQFVPALQSSISKCVGLPSKIAGSRVLVSMVLKNPYIVKPYGDLLLKLCINQMKDRNDTVASSYAMAAAYWCRVSSIDAVAKYSKVLRKLYFVSDNDRNREISAVANEFVSKYSGDMFSSMASEFLPLAFIAKHDPLESVRDPFEREWSNTTGGVGAIKLYLGEISLIISDHIMSSNFQIRQVCAKSIAEAANKLDNTSGVPKYVHSLFSVLIQACQGRSWKGKETVIDSLVSLSIKFEKYIETEADGHVLLDKISDTVIAEAKRRNRDYQRESIKSFGRFLGVFPSAGRTNEYISILSGMLEDEYYVESDDEDEDMDFKSSKKDVSASRRNLHREEERLGFMANLIQAFSLDEYGDFSPALFDLALDRIVALFSSEVIKTTWRTDLAASGYLISLLDKFKKLESVSLTDDQLTRLERTWIRVAEECTREESTQNVNVQFINACGSILTFLKKTVVTDEEFKSRFDEAIKLKLQEIRTRENNSVLDVRIKKALQA
ncbi:unnamed protein product [Kuraishia capsulata CBS 1993]|uniref:TATA-binding protein interacting (TIP20) domain-containing protein n=1 Tax=Kuraishia capsulata CBS 1993 TaxID=1382522 RepID=W6MMM7_9ASCO|nr:uncharacterized protein KUCA_T00003795001 [Kuraishia capsulata CBS 1993]CDK27816.1 unnamed protein product [Kuraishia capsulata CBS 1993]